MATMAADIGDWGNKACECDAVFIYNRTKLKFCNSLSTAILSKIFSKIAADSGN
jgi:hypothetical protein